MNAGDVRLQWLGALAAGAAHELRSPLATMAQLVDDLRRGRLRGPHRRAALDQLAEQIGACERTLSELTAYGEHAAAPPREQPLGALLAEVFARWRRLRPGTALDYRAAQALAGARITADDGLRQALLNLLNNAADASPEAVQIRCVPLARALRLLILDRGPGIAAGVRAALAARRPASTKAKGCGLGLAIAREAIERAGGSLRLQDRPGGGTLVEVILPLAPARRAVADPATYQGMRDQGIENLVAR